MELKINKLRGRMGELGFTLTQLEKDTGVSRTSLRFILKGERQPKHATILKICHALKIEEKRISYYFPNYAPETPVKKERD